MGGEKMNFGEGADLDVKHHLVDVVEESEGAREIDRNLVSIYTCLRLTLTLDGLTCALSHSSGMITSSSAIPLFLLHW